MRLDYWEVLENLVGLFLLIAAGYAAVGLELLPRESGHWLSRLILKMTLPCSIFVSLLRPYDPAFLGDMFATAVLGVAIFAMTALLSLFLRHLAGVPEGRRGVWSFAVTCSNNVFMGFPISQALFGEEGLALAAVFNVPYTLLIQSVGARMIAGDRPPQNGERPKPVSWCSVLVTAINLSAAAGLVFYFLRLTPPTALLTPLTYIANLTTPLSMFVTGINLTGCAWGELFRDRDALTACAGRLVGMPLLACAFLKGVNRLMPFGNPRLLGVVLLVVSMPTAAAGALLAENYGANREFAARTVFLSSLLCIVTLPLIALLV